MNAHEARGSNVTADSLFDDIDSLLEESSRTGAAEAAAVEDLDDLDSLLNESLALKEEAAAGKRYRDKLKKGGMPADEKAYIEAKLREWEAAREWETLSVCALFAKQTCTCGHQSTIFKGFYYHQKHRSDKHAQRWVGVAQVGEHAKALPQRTMLEDAVTAICSACASANGFNLEQGEQAWTK